MNNKLLSADDEQPKYLDRLLIMENFGFGLCNICQVSSMVGRSELHRKLHSLCENTNDFS